MPACWAARFACTDPIAHCTHEQRTAGMEALRYDHSLQLKDAFRQRRRVHHFSLFACPGTRTHEGVNSRRGIRHAIETPHFDVSKAFSRVCEQAHDHPSDRGAPLGKHAHGQARKCWPAAARGIQDATTTWDQTDLESFTRP
jgi:hypothetical protein